MGAGKPSFSKELLSPYSSIFINGMFSVQLLRDSLSYIEFSGGKNIISHCSATITNSRVHINNNNTCNFLQSYQGCTVVIHYTAIDSLIVNAPCSIQTDTLLSPIYIDVATDMIDMNVVCKNPKLTIKTMPTAGGVINVSGSAEQSFLSAQYALKFITDDFSTLHAHILNNSIHSFTLSVAESVQADSKKDAWIYIKGDPPKKDIKRNVVFID